jgi:hypothetical protein
MSRKPQTKLSPSAIYTRRYRARIRGGQIRLAIVMDEAALTAMLVDREVSHPWATPIRCVDAGVVEEAVPSSSYAVAGRRQLRALANRLGGYQIGISLN